MQTKHLIPLVAAAMLAVAPGAPVPLLEEAFINPPPETRPGCYWYWINDNISKEGITRDLEAMARVGIGRAYIGHIFGEGPRWETPVGKVPFMSDAWWEALQWAVKEADRCGVEIGFFNSPGWSQSGGPWVKPSQSMRYLAASETVIEGGRRVGQVLPVPEITTFPNAGGSEQKADRRALHARGFPGRAGDRFPTTGNGSHRHRHGAGEGFLARARSAWKCVR